jgi:hypothetical protein
MERTRSASLSIANGFVSTCMPGSRWPWPMTAARNQGAARYRLRRERSDWRRLSRPWHGRAEKAVCTQCARTQNQRDDRASIMNDCRLDSLTNTAYKASVANALFEASATRYPSLSLFISMAAAKASAALTVGSVRRIGCTRTEWSASCPRSSVFGSPLGVGLL